MTERLDIMDGPIDFADSFNLMIIRSAGYVVMGRKTRGYGKDMLVLPGGKDQYYLGNDGIGIMPPGYDAAREAFEEVGVDIETSFVKQAGILHVATENDNKDIKIFEASCRKTSLKVSSELTELDWYKESKLEYTKMPSDYRLWLPHILSGYAVTAFFETDREQIVNGKIFRQQLNPLGRAEQVSF